MDAHFWGTSIAPGFDMSSMEMLQMQLCCSPMCDLHGEVVCGVLRALHGCSYSVGMRGCPLQQCKRGCSDSCTIPLPGSHLFGAGTRAVVAPGMV